MIVYDNDPWEEKVCNQCGTGIYYDDTERLYCCDCFAVEPIPDDELMPTLEHVPDFWVDAEQEDISTRVLMETLEQAAVYLEAGGAHISADRLRTLARALYRRPHICEMVQREMSKIMVEDIRAIK